MTKQDIFDTVVRHAATMKRRCLVGKELSRHCYYRGDTSKLDELKGLKCFAGIFIPDDVYVEDMDKNNSQINVIVSKYPQLQGILGDNTEFINRLQLIHDMSKMHSWFEAFQRFVGDNPDINGDVLNEIGDVWKDLQED